MATEVLAAIERESARVAAAFGVKEWERSEDELGCGYYLSLPDSLKWYVGHEGLISIRVMRGWGWARVFFNGYEWEILYARRAPLEEMTRGLFCLGFQDAAILAQLPALSAHEKLELRLNLPREFWPQKWIDEADSVTKHQSET